MATTNQQLLTLAETAKRTDPNGMPAMIAELLSQTNEILQDVPWVPSNLPTGHRSTIRTGLPSVTLRRINEGVSSTRSTTEQITDGMSLLETWTTTDAKLLDLSANKAATRLQEAEAHIEAMGQKATELLFLGDEGDDEREFNGLLPRYDTLSGNVSDNVISSGGSGADNSSIWLVGWGDNKVFGIYPKGTVAGLQHKDHGMQVAQDPTDTTGFGGAKMAAFMDQWTWDMGLVVKDWRYVVRIANIDMSNLATLFQDGTAGQDPTDYNTAIIYQMARALHRIPNLSACRPAFYMTRSMFEGFDLMSLATANANVFRTRDIDGRPLMTFRGVPLRICDQITHTEDVVSA